jgi:hypothetical protein
MSVNLKNIHQGEHGRVENWRAYLRVFGVLSAAFATGLSPTPLVTFPAPPGRKDCTLAALTPTELGVQL